MVKITHSVISFLAVQPYNLLSSGPTISTPIHSNSVSTRGNGTSGACGTVLGLFHDMRGIAYKTGAHLFPASRTMSQPCLYFIPTQASQWNGVSQLLQIVPERPVDEQLMAHFPDLGQFVD